MSNRRKVKWARRVASNEKMGQQLAQVFFGVGIEKLSDQLIRELEARGWPRKDLESFRDAGASYSRPRDSIMFPPEFD